jgi:hypothetical protein
MLLFVPLGDVVDRRWLIVTLLCCVTGSLLLAAFGVVDRHRRAAA